MEQPPDSHGQLAEKRGRESPDYADDWRREERDRPVGWHDTDRAIARGDRIERVAGIQALSRGKVGERIAGDEAEGKAERNDRDQDADRNGHRHIGHEP